MRSLLASSAPLALFLILAACDPASPDPSAPPPEADSPADAEPAPAPEAAPAAPSEASAEPTVDGPPPLPSGFVTVRNEAGGFALELPASHSALETQERFPGRYAYRYDADDGESQRVVVWTSQRRPSSVQDVAELVGRDERFGLVEIRAWSDGRFLAHGERRGRHRVRVLGGNLVATCGNSLEHTTLNASVCASVRPL